MKNLFIIVVMCLSICGFDVCSSTAEKQGQEDSSDSEVLEIGVDFFNTIERNSANNPTIERPGLSLEMIEQMPDDDKKELRSRFFEKIGILQRDNTDRKRFIDKIKDVTITLDELNKDFQNNTDFNRVMFVDQDNEEFMSMVNGLINKIMQNPVGLAIINRILNDEQTDRKILFVEISGFYNFGLQSCEKPVVAALSGDQYMLIVIPNDIPNDQMLHCALPGINKKTFRPTIIQANPLHVALAHELIHCMHEIENKKLHDSMRMRKNLCTLVSKEQYLNDLQEFPTDEELYTVLGMKSDKSMANICGDEVSELTYSLFDNDIGSTRILYYNLEGNEDFSALNGDLLKRLLGLIFGVDSVLYKRFFDVSGER